MSQHLKRWESPRRKGRNDKGRGGAARQRQLQKRSQTLRRRLKGLSVDNQSTPKGESHGSPLLIIMVANPEKGGANLGDHNVYFELTLLCRHWFTLGSAWLGAMG